MLLLVAAAGAAAVFFQGICFNPPSLLTPSPTLIETLTLLKPFDLILDRFYDGRIFKAFKDIGRREKTTSSSSSS
jgi:hypothetical protein